MSRRRPNDTESDQNHSSPEKKGSPKNEESDLDEELDPIFHPPPDTFPLATLTSHQDSDVDASHHFNETDFQSHRLLESSKYHQPLERLHRKVRKHKRTSNEDSQSPPKLVEEDETDEPTVTLILGGLETVKIQSDSPESTQESPSKKKEEDTVMFYVGGSTSSLEAPDPSAKEQPLHSIIKGLLAPTIQTSAQHELQEMSSDDVIASSSSATAETSFTVPDVTKPKVKFMLGESSKDDVRRTVSEAHGSQHNRHLKKHSVKRKHHGFKVAAKRYNSVLEADEAETLFTADIDDMASHRFEDPRGMQTHKIFDHSSFQHNEVTAMTSQTAPKRVYDREPHELFVELHELKEFEPSDVLEWRQTARWIKYEEDVELGPDKWGKPHVPPLSFHSLLKLRQCLESGAVLIDLEENDMLGISKRVVECMVQTDQIYAGLRDAVLGTLMLRHRHVNEKAPPPLRRNSSGYGNLNLLSHDRNRSPIFKRRRPKSDELVVRMTVNPESVVLMPENNNAANVSEVVEPAKRRSVAFDRAHEQGIQKRVPWNAEGCAVLVGEMEDLEHPATVFVRLAEGKQLPNFLEISINVRFLFILLGPPQFDLDYHEVGRAFGALMSNFDFHTATYKASGRNDLLRAINDFLDKSIVVPPGKWENKTLLPLDEIRRKSLVPPRRIADEPLKEEPEKPGYDPLKRTGKVFGGFLKDIRHRYPWYLSDITDALNFQCLASVIFIYFAAVSGAIAFGGLLSDKTGSEIGVTETLIGTSVCGILFSLLSGQPLIIIGTTAPLVLVDETLYKFKESFTDFLIVRTWVGIWTATIAVVVVAAEGSVLVKFFSRFMQEIFATIISLIFIFEAISKLYTIFVKHPLIPLYCNETKLQDMVNNTLVNGTTGFMDDKYPAGSPRPNAALFSTILMLGTFYIAFSLRHFRNSKFLVGKARRALGDFGVPIALVMMVTLDYFFPYGFTEKLAVPDGFSPSKPRSWIISPFPIAGWEVAVGFLGGLLVFILMFLETQICELIISKKKLKKGSGFHVDMVMVGFMAMVSGFIGGPWQCAATVRSITHTASLLVMSKTHAPGETPHIVEVKEQRLTNFLVSLLVGLSTLMSSVLRQVPFAVLFGVFLYMGISALSGIHLYERFLLFFMHPKNHPDFNFVRKVRLKQMHIYTAIQVVCIAVLWIIKTYVTMAFPFGLLSLVLVHYAIQKDFFNIFHPDEIKALDEEDPERKEEDEPDFYEQIVA